MSRTPEPLKKTAYPHLHVAMRRYQTTTAAEEEEQVVGAMREELLPVVDKVPGLVAYLIVSMGEGRLHSVSVSKTMAGLEDTRSHEANWVGAHLAHTLNGPLENDVGTMSAGILWRRAGGSDASTARESESEVEELRHHVRELREAVVAQRDPSTMWEHQLLSFVLRKDSNCVDIGASRGSMLAAILHRAPEGTHIAYEPIPSFYQCLKVEFPTVDVRRAAISNVGGGTDFLHIRNLPARSGIREVEYPTQPDIERLSVPCTRLDDDLPTDYVPDLIKIDVEGAEGLVLEGAARTITTHRPIVMFEHGLRAWEYYGTSPSDIFGLLCQDAGLRLYRLDGVGPLTLAEFERSVKRCDVWNYVGRV